jgi:flagellar biosynthesis/type III secretory pathway protein FliH
MTTILALAGAAITYVVVTLATSRRAYRRAYDTGFADGSEAGWHDGYHQGRADESHSLPVRTEP